MPEDVVKDIVLDCIGNIKSILKDLTSIMDLTETLVKPLGSDKYVIDLLTDSDFINVVELKANDILEKCELANNELAGRR